MTAFYNEHDPFCAAWLRKLIEVGAIAPGVVDERDIRDIKPSELAGYTQCHFFAGIGTWSYALRRAGWSDDQPCWTGSPPCQPFSGIGRQKGFEDERHLWPVFYQLILYCRPAVIFGEQVASVLSIGKAAVQGGVTNGSFNVAPPEAKEQDQPTWVDALFDDLERARYSCGAAVLPACSVGAPHIRERLYFVAERDTLGRMGHANDEGLEGHSGGHPAESGQRQAEVRPVATPSQPGGLAEANSTVAQQPQGSRTGSDEAQGTRACGEPDRCDPLRGSAEPGPTNGFWRAADWLKCRDAKWRPVEARVQQMVGGAALRLGPLCPDLKQAIEGVLNEEAQRLQTSSHEVLREVRQTLDSAGLPFGTGELQLVHEAQVLLSCLLEYTGTQGFVSDGQDGAGTSTSPERDLRVLWRERQVGDSSHQRGLERQPLRELADTLRLLSSAVARFASEAGYPNVYTDAPASFPLAASGSSNQAQDSLGGVRPKNRVGRLRAYGNAIVSPLATEFIAAYMDTLSPPQKEAA